MVGLDEIYLVRSCAVEVFETYSLLTLGVDALLQLRLGRHSEDSILSSLPEDVHGVIQSTMCTIITSTLKDK